MSFDNETIIRFLMMLYLQKKLKKLIDHWGLCRDIFDHPSLQGNYLLFSSYYKYLEVRYNRIGMHKNFYFFHT